MRRCVALLGVSVVLMMASAIGLPAVADASGGPSVAALGSPLAHHPSTPTGGGGAAAAPAPPSPALPHGLGSRVVVPSTWSMVPSPNAGSSSDQNQLNGVS